MEIINTYSRELKIERQGFKTAFESQEKDFNEKMEKLKNKTDSQSIKERNSILKKHIVITTLLPVLYQIKNETELNKTSEKIKELEAQQEEQETDVESLAKQLAPLIEKQKEYNNFMKKYLVITHILTKLFGVSQEMVDEQQSELLEKQKLETSALEEMKQEQAAEIKSIQDMYSTLQNNHNVLVNTKGKEINELNETVTALSKKIENMKDIQDIKSEEYEGLQDEYNNVIEKMEEKEKQLDDLTSGDALALRSPVLKEELELLGIRRIGSAPNILAPRSSLNSLRLPYSYNKNTESVTSDDENTESIISFTSNNSKGNNINNYQLFDNTNSENGEESLQDIINKLRNDENKIKSIRNNILCITGQPNTVHLVCNEIKKILQQMETTEQKTNKIKNYIVPLFKRSIDTLQKSTKPTIQKQRCSKLGDNFLHEVLIGLDDIAANNGCGISANEELKPQFDEVLIYIINNITEYKMSNFGFGESPLSVKLPSITPYNTLKSKNSMANITGVQVNTSGYSTNLKKILGLNK